MGSNVFVKVGGIRSTDFVELVTLIQLMMVGIVCVISGTMATGISVILVTRAVGDVVDLLITNV